MKSVRGKIPAGCRMIFCVCLKDTKQGSNRGSKQHNEKNEPQNLTWKCSKLGSLKNGEEMGVVLELCIPSLTKSVNHSISIYKSLKI